jgi:cell division septation protein DedD
MERIQKWLKKYFVPHEGNSYKPHFLRHEAMLSVFFVVIVIELGFLVQVFLVFNKTNFLAEVLPGVLTSLTNQERAQNNVPPLTENALLDQAAQDKANDMATFGYFAHTSPEGKTPWYWFGLVGYRYQAAGENLAVNYFESADVATAWMNSPEHRANIVKAGYTDIGIGVASGVYEGQNTVFVAQEFGKPFPVASAEELIPPATPPTAPVATPTPAPIKPKTTPAPVAPKTTAKTTPTVATKPVVTPPTVVITPVAIKILGEETTSAPTTTTNFSIFSTLKLFVEKVLTSPGKYVNYIYGAFLALIVMALLMAIFIKSEMQHPAILLRGFSLLAIVIALLFINIKVVHVKTNVEASGASATVLEAFSQ